MGQLTIDYLRDSGSAVMGDPDACIAAAKRYEAVGCDLLLCLVNPYKIPHEKVMQIDRAHGQARAAGVQVSTDERSHRGQGRADHRRGVGPRPRHRRAVREGGRGRRRRRRHRGRRRARRSTCATKPRSSALVDAIVAEHGRLDVVVNYAGVAGGGPVHMVDADDWDRVLEVNLKGTFLVNKHALRPMLEQRSGQHRQHRQRRGAAGHRGRQLVQRVEGCGRRAHQEHGDRLRPGRHPRQRHLPRLHRHARCSAR